MKSLAKQKAQKLILSAFKFSDSCKGRVHWFDKDIEPALQELFDASEDWDEDELEEIGLELRECGKGRMGNPIYGVVAICQIDKEIK